ncbi:TetR family transcriptional regulator [Nocardioides ginsengisoli]|uniref:TetR/AcrR family transcriptional regulator n=1 Tax=Nocardioides ginsengisoli TaxID=363868 RepID=A0ABW3W7F1_9ACTN
MTRVYDSAARREQAAHTRARIIETAVAVLLRDGLAAMTVTSLAREAGVSPQTIYNSIGGKAEVVKAAYDVTLAGDNDTTPMSERPAFRAIQDAPDLPTFAHAYAHWSAEIYRRVGPLLAVLISHGSAGDPLLEDFLTTIDTERRRGTTNALQGLAARGVVPADADLELLTDGVWALTAPDNWRRLVQVRGWSSERYEWWLAASMGAVLRDG